LASRPGEGGQGRSGNAVTLAPEFTRWLESDEEQKVSTTPSVTSKRAEGIMTIRRHGSGQLLSRVVEHGDTVYVQGLAADDKSLDIQGQTRQVLAKIDQALALAGTDKSHLLSAQIFVADIALRPALNEVWAAWIDPEQPPIRVCVGVQLAGDTKVEIVVVAAKKR